MIFIDLTTWGFIGVVAFFTVSKGDIRHFGRGLGFYTGKAIGWLQIIRGEFLSNGPLWTLQEELAKSVLQLQTVKSDVRRSARGLSLLNTGTVQPTAVPTSNVDRQREAKLDPGEQVQEHLASTIADPTVSGRQQLPFKGGPVVSGDPAPVSRPIDGDVRATAGTSTKGRGEGAGEGMGGIQRWGHFGLDDSIRPDIFVDVSAADVGRAGNSTQGRKCGSDILADALDEEEVAAMSARFMAASQGGESRGRGESIE